MKAAAIDVVLFDLGGVLVETAGVDRMLEWSPGLGTADELWRRWLHSQAVRRFETGRIARDEFAAALVAEFAIPVGPDAFLAEFADWPRAVLPGAFELLSAMRARYRIASVSNTNEIHWERIANGLALHDAFLHNFPSFEVGKLKPDADYFEHVLQALDAPAHRVLFIDDNAINVDAAASLGMHARRVQGVHGARAAFVELGLLGDR
jgi:HAD superfamily hydrolase (TIGR01509 family)